MAVQKEGRVVQKEGRKEGWHRRKKGRKGGQKEGRYRRKGGTEGKGCTEGRKEGRNPCHIGCNCDKVVSFLSTCSNLKALSQLCHYGQWVVLSLLGSLVPFVVPFSSGEDSGWYLGQLVVVSLTSDDGWWVGDDVRGDKGGR
jgi:hypothetical protein